MSGFGTSASKLGAPDTGLLSYYEMLEQGRYIHEATSHIPIIGDGDTGYGNAMNVKRTVHGYSDAGFAGILIEDQVWPKSCGHVKGKRVTSREEAIARIRAAADARDEGADILVVARTDARQAESLGEALWRVEAFADAGADVLFIDALQSEEEMRRFARLGGGAASLPKMANMLEGGGRTPLLPPELLAAMGFKLVAYPLSLLGVSMVAMQRALEGLKDGRVPSSTDMGSFADIQRVLGFQDYYAEAERYVARSTWQSVPVETGPAPSATAATTPLERPAAADPVPITDGTGASTGPSTGTVVEPEVFAPGQRPVTGDSSEAASTSSPSSAPGVDLLVASQRAGDGGGGQGGGRGPFGASTVLRVKIADARTGLVKLETRIPAGFLGGVTALIPQVAGMNLEALMEQALGEKWDLSKPILNLNSGSDVVQIFLE